MLAYDLMTRFLKSLQSIISNKVTIVIQEHICTWFSIETHVDQYGKIFNICCVFDAVINTLYRKDFIFNYTCITEHWKVFVIELQFLMLFSDKRCNETLTACGWLQRERWRWWKAQSCRSGETDARGEWRLLASLDTPPPEYERWTPTQAEQREGKHLAFEKNKLLQDKKMSEHGRETSMCTYPDVCRVQQQISEGSVVFRGENVVLSVNDVQTQRTELLHLHWLPPVVPGQEKVPEEEKRERNLRVSGALSGPLRIDAQYPHF